MINEDKFLERLKGRIDQEVIDEDELDNWDMYETTEFELLTIKEFQELDKNDKISYLFQMTDNYKETKLNGASKVLNEVLQKQLAKEGDKESELNAELLINDIITQFHMLFSIDCDEEYIITELKEYDWSRLDKVYTCLTEVYPRYADITATIYNDFRNHVINNTGYFPK